MQPGIWQLLIVAALVLILFGRGRISEMMGDVGKGIRSFRKGMSDEEKEAAEKKEAEDKGPPPRLEGPRHSAHVKDGETVRSSDAG